MPPNLVRAQAGRVIGALLGNPVVMKGLRSPIIRTCGGQGKAPWMRSRALSCRSQPDGMLRGLLQDVGACERRR